MRARRRPCSAARAAGGTLLNLIAGLDRPTGGTVMVGGGLVIATLGALLPATWAVRTSTATALRTE